MLAVLGLLGVSTVRFAPPQLWINGFAALPRIALAADVTGDGLADLIAVYDGGIDVAPNRAAQKTGAAFQALSGWGKNPEAAIAGDFDGKPGADVLALFEGKTLRLAGAFDGAHFADAGTWATLPSALKQGRLAWLNKTTLVAYSPVDGKAFRIEVSSRQATAIKVPAGTDAITEADGRLVFHRKDRDPYPVSVGGSLVGVDALHKADLPHAGSRLVAADLDGDGDEDIFEFRAGSEPHVATGVYLYRQVSGNETDADDDGLDAAAEAKAGTDPLVADTDGDGLLDGWEVNGFRGLDLPGMGCDPKRIDCVVLLARFADVPEDRMKADLDRASRYYDSLGWRLHIKYIDPIAGEDMKQGWWANRDKFLPAKWRGVAHFMQVTNGGGGQADQLGDGGSCGLGALWAVFLHEFGHQLGLDHEGFWGVTHCPTYTSMMNYAYSYTYEGTIDKIHYSDGRLADFVLRESELSEVLPLPYDKVKFLEQAPYHYRLKTNGDTTLVDWNWNGVFGEKKIKADINYAYSTNAGRRDEIDKLHTAPWLFSHNGVAYAVYGKHDRPGAPPSDPSIRPDNLGKLYLRSLAEPFKWNSPVEIAPELAGDPVGISFRGAIQLFYATSKGIFAQRVKAAKNKLEPEPAVEVSDNPSLVPTVGIRNGRLFLFLWNPVSGAIEYRTETEPGKWSLPLQLYTTSTVPPGMTFDPIAKEVVLGMGQDQDGGRLSRWQIRRFREVDGRLTETGMEWVDGPAGGSRGTGRVTLLFDSSRDAGPKGRVLLFGKGYTTKDSPYSCTYVAQQIADKTINGGWLVKRYYDEWTQSRSAPAACWFGDDILWAYRWADGSQGDRDNLFHVGYRGSGIDLAPMGDHDDIGFLKRFGIRACILWMNAD